MFVQLKEKTLIDKQLHLLDQQKLHKRKQSESKKFLKVVTSELVRQTSIKTVKEIKKNTANLQKGRHILPIQKLFFLKNIENWEEQDFGLIKSVRPQRKIQTRKQPKPIPKQSIQKLSISQETQVGRGTSRIWSRENSPIHRLLQVSGAYFQHYQ